MTIQYNSIQLSALLYHRGMLTECSAWTILLTKKVTGSKTWILLDGFWNGPRIRTHVLEHMSILTRAAESFWATQGKLLWFIHSKRHSDLFSIQRERDCQRQTVCVYVSNDHCVVMCYSLSLVMNDSLQHQIEESK